MLSFLTLPIIKPPPVFLALEMSPMYLTRLPMIFWQNTKRAFPLSCTCFCHCCFIYGHFLPQKCRSSRFRVLTHTQEYILTYLKGERNVHWDISTLNCSVFVVVTTCGKHQRLLKKPLWELLCCVANIGHVNRMQCCDYILPHMLRFTVTY